MRSVGARVSSELGEKFAIDLGARGMKIERALRELRQLRESAGDREFWDRMVAQIFEQPAGEVSHVEERDVGERVARSHGLLRCVAGRARHMLEPGGARDVDAAVDRMNPCRAGEGHDDAGRAEDGKPADDAEARVPGFCGERLAAGNGDFDLGVGDLRRVRSRPPAIASIIILRGTGLIAGSPGGIGKPGKRDRADALPGLETDAVRRPRGVAPSRRSPPDASRRGRRRHP